MKPIDGRWVVITCDSNFVITDLITIKNIEMNIKINDNASKMVAYYNLSKFLDFTLILRNEIL